MIKKVHLGDSKITSGTVMEMPWEKIRPYLQHMFNLRKNETITEVQPTLNGIRIVIERRNIINISLDLY